MTRRVLAGLLAISLSGCASFTTMSTARTLPAGHWQFSLAPIGLHSEDWAIGEGDIPGSFTFVQLEAGARYGLTDSLELGGKLWLGGVGVDLKWQLLRTEFLDVAVDPGVGYLALSGEGGTLHVVTLYPALLLGIPLGGGSQLVLGPKVVDQIFIAAAGGQTASESALFAGSTVGIALRLGERFTLLPEVAFMWPVEVGATAPVFYRGLTLQGGVGLLFGG